MSKKETREAYDKKKKSRLFEHINKRIYNTVPYKKGYKVHKPVKSVLRHKQYFLTWTKFRKGRYLL